MMWGDQRVLSFIDESSRVPNGIGGVIEKNNHLLNGHQAGAEEILDAVHSWRDWSRQVVGLVEPAL